MTKTYTEITIRVKLEEPWDKTKEEWAEWLGMFLNNNAISPRERVTIVAYGNQPEGV